MLFSIGHPSYHAINEELLSVNMSPIKARQKLRLKLVSKHMMFRLFLLMLVW